MGQEVLYEDLNVNPSHIEGYTTQNLSQLNQVHTSAGFKVLMKGRHSSFVNPENKFSQQKQTTYAYGQRTPQRASYS